MKILILGGTAFAGRHITAAMLNNGHQVTLFNRSKTNANLFPQAERLIGDRDGNLEALKGRSWDAVIDVNGYLPRLVGDTARLLQESVGHYIFVSTAGVYDMENIAGEVTEQSPLCSTDGIDTEEIWGGAYAPLKVLCENVVDEYFSGRSTILRLGLVVGPFDTTDRLTYWVDRVERGGDVLVPQSPNDPIQYIDARDLADFAVKVIESRHMGVFNVVNDVSSWANFLNACNLVTGSNANFVWVDLDFVDQNVGSSYRPFGPFPLKDIGYIFRVANQKACEAGLQHRSVEETVRGLLEWHCSRIMSDKEINEMDFSVLVDLDYLVVGQHWLTGISAEHEKTLLSEWQKRSV